MSFVDCDVEMANKRASDTPPHCYTVSVVGLSGTDSIKGKQTQPLLRIPDFCIFYAQPFYNV